MAFWSVSCSAGHTFGIAVLNLQCILNIIGKEEIKHSNLSFSPSSHPILCAQNDHSKKACGVSFFTTEVFANLAG
jgi:hypothetical protein